jgi:hypothetical protein
MTEAYIIDACRTPRGVGKPGKGALADIHPQHLALRSQALADAINQHQRSRRYHLGDESQRARSWRFGSHGRFGCGL